MKTERGLLATVAIVLVFSLLWSLAILLPVRSASVVPIRTFAKSNTHVGANGTQKLPNSNHDLNNEQNHDNMTTKRAVSPPMLRQIPFAPAKSEIFLPSSIPYVSRAAEKRLFPRYVWYIIFVVLYKTRNSNLRGRRLDEDELLLMKTSWDSQLEYGLKSGDEEVPRIDHYYGAVSYWKPELDKFDLDQP